MEARGLRERDERGRTWPQFVGQWIVNEGKWIKRVKPEPNLFALVLRAQFEGVIDRDTAKAYFGG